MAKKLIRFLALTGTGLILFILSGSARSQVVYPPYYYHGIYQSYPIGYGYFAYSPWPNNYWFNPTWNGFSYWNYYGQLPRLASFGALAYSAESDQVGWSWGAASRDAAANTAVQGCQAGDCEPVVWVQGACAALVTNRFSSTVSWAYAQTKLRAANYAMQSCRASGGAGGCVRRAWICSF